MLAAQTKRSVNLAINGALIQEAKALEINLSREFEAHLTRLVKLRQQEKWLIENREALDAYNAHIERDGVFSDGLRGF
ncbi:MAG: type II toxin-antitoxin system CcdA family antitoxin [Gallionella sp.]|nr:type II toxin-antitoxin system CcdA family antitoxin [Gallionella sp.]